MNEEEVNKYAIISPEKMEKLILACLDTKKPVSIQYILEQLRRVAGKFPEPMLVAKMLQHLVEQRTIKMTPRTTTEFEKAKFYLSG